MSPVFVIVFFLLAASSAGLQKRTINRCAQDGAYFYAMNDDPARAVDVKLGGVGIRIEYPDLHSTDAVVTLSRGNRVLVQTHKDFEAAEGWLTISNAGAFAITWNENASSAETQLFHQTSSGEVAEDSGLINLAEKRFVSDATRVCKTPGSNTTAIKWLDDDHLLLAINAWSSGFCYSNFTEGFIVSMSEHKIEKKLSEPELIHLPAVCTWNLVPVTPPVRSR